MPAPYPNRTKEECERRGCLWDLPSQVYQSCPMCFFPRKSGYISTSSIGNTIKLEKYDDVENPFDTNISPIFFTWNTIANTTLNIRIGPSQRYEPKIDIPRESFQTKESFTIEQSNEIGVFSFKVKRISTNATIWDTSIGGMMFADQFIQIAAFLGSSDLYGIGENTQFRLKHDMMAYITWPIFARDESPPSVFNATQHYSTSNPYGTFPFYIALESDNKAHGVFILNSNAQEFTTGPAPHIIYRTIGGMLDIYFFPGPTPENVVQQYLALIGKPSLPPYWALGFQLGRFGFKSFDEMQQRISEVQKVGIPLDVVYVDRDYMDGYQDFTLKEGWEQLPTYIKHLHDENIYTMLIFDPSIQAESAAFERAITAGARFLEWESEDEVQREVQDLYPLARNTKVMLGVSWPDRHVAFADFSASETAVWWQNEITRFHKQVPFDGMWLSMNEPSNFGTNRAFPEHFDDPNHPNITTLKCPLSGNNSKFDMPPYETYNVYKYNERYLSSNTLCMLALTENGKLYDTKNLYGLKESLITKKALQAVTSKRGAIITRSSFPSSGQYAGHWLGENSATWYDLTSSIVGIQLFNIFGIPFVGADICGYRGNTSEDLCLRWQQLGAFYPLSRNTNSRGTIAQDPAIWPSVAKATLQANLFRYHYLPYLYTLLAEASMSGGTVIRPLFFEFPYDEYARNVSNQFMWGSAILVMPYVMERDHNMEPLNSVHGYLPINATWYSLRENDYGVAAQSGFASHSSTINEFLPVFIRGNSIVPRQSPRATTTASRKNPFELLIALDAKWFRRAAGLLYWDSGDSIDPFYEYRKWQIAYLSSTTQASLVINPAYPQIINAKWFRRAAGLLYWDSGDSIDPFYEYRKWQIAYLSSTTQASLVINPAYPQVMFILPL
uniref:P-type domain-containing protein n=1 Tax=Ascaris lumbricoides TaxID=6252 RepID=A0A9J2QAZ4_ASCLU